MQVTFFLPLTNNTIKAPCPNLQTKMYFNQFSGSERRQPRQPQISLRSQVDLALHAQASAKKSATLKPIWRPGELYLALRYAPSSLTYYVKQ